ncbi:MAG: hypothetical protein ACLQIQ_08515 [Beijerinckiaceae bacterium]
MIGVLVGLQAEAAIIGSDPGFAVFCDLPGKQQMALAAASGALTALVSLGTCGALAPRLGVGDVVLGTAVITGGGDMPLASAAWVQRLPYGVTVERGPVLSLGQIETDTPTQRAALFKKYGAAAIDEQSKTVAETANAHHLPFIIVRCVSDDARDTIPPAARIATNADGSTNFLNIVKSIGNDPAQIVGLLRIASEFDKAIRSLTNYWAAAAPIVRGGA